MTTPAIDKNIETFTTGLERRTYVNGVVTDAQITGLLNREIEKRPESVNSPVVSGHRLPTAFFHYGCRNITTSQCRVVGTRDTTTPSLTKKIELRNQAVTRSVHAGGRFMVTENSLQMQAEAETKALLKLKDQDFNVSVFVAEGKDALETVRSRLLKTGRLFTDIKEKDARIRKEWKRMLRSEGHRARNIWKLGDRISGAWLEFYYGWLPINRDICGAINHVVKLSRKESPTVHVYGNSKETSTDIVSEELLFNLISSEKLYLDISRETERHTKVRLDYLSVMPELQDATQLGLTNPLEVVYERSPLSFVVDWGLGVGDFIRAMDATLGWQFLSGSCSRIARRRDVSARFRDATNNPSTTWTFTGVPDLYECYNFRRSKYLSSPIPGIWIKDPFTGGTTRAMNALSLMFQMFLGKEPPARYFN